MRLFSNRRRPVHLGPWPLERLSRTDAPPATAAAPEPGAPRDREPGPPVEGLARLIRSYQEIFLAFREGRTAPQRAPLPDDPAAMSRDLKAGCYFLDATMAGICAIPPGAWRGGPPPEHGHALVILVEHSREPEDGNPAAGWTAGAADERSAMRAAEIACTLAGYLAILGFGARAHGRAATDVDLSLMAAHAGLTGATAAGPAAPFIGRGFALAAVTTELALAPDRPLAPGALRRARRLPAWWSGFGGTRSLLSRRAEARRPTHLSRWPMERLRRRPRPTTLILEDEVPRVPKRAAFFERALRGDLGEKARRERRRFVGKHPFARAMMPLSSALVPGQDGEVAPTPATGTDDPEANARAVKSLCYWLGADLVGICEARPRTWYSHDGDGRPIAVRHRYAIALLIDQGHETMEGSSGDDWVSGSQSLRAYLRGGEITGLVAGQLRALGHAARSHSNIDSQVLHIPLILDAGLGELSRIGELVLNPFVGPRFKSAIITTDMPLAIDRPVDFGLQDFCESCNKCARECPCDAISLGGKVMFNGYEMWKPDVERCARYRVTNPRGSACGRCMKTCPWNHEGLPGWRLLAWAAMRWRRTHRFIVWLDDRVGNGRRNPVKKWWLDLEIIERRVGPPRVGANSRELDPGRDLDPAKRKIAIYPAAVMPAPDAGDMVVPVDRKAALASGAAMETPAQARARRGLAEPGAD